MVLSVLSCITPRMQAWSPVGREVGPVGPRADHPTRIMMSEEVKAKPTEKTEEMKQAIAMRKAT